MSALILGPLGTIGHYILTPLYYAVSGVMLSWHWLFTKIGLDPDGGASWALSIIGLTIVIRAALIPLFVKQINASRNMQLHPAQGRRSCRRSTATTGSVSPRRR